MSGTFWTIEQVEPIIRERDQMKDVADVLSQRIAELEAKNERLREQIEKQARQIMRLEVDLRQAINDAAREGE